MLGRIVRRLLGRGSSTPARTGERSPTQSMPQAPSAPTPPAHGPPLPSPGSTPELVLFKYDTCPYCRRVLRALEPLGLDVKFEDTMQDRSARGRLRERTGRTTVPCLFVDGEALFESADIIDWLEAYAHQRAASA